eukprot:1299075-Lingulodinium_polyedra.AAC.1
MGACMEALQSLKASKLCKFCMDAERNELTITINLVGKLVHGEGGASHRNLSPFVQKIITQLLLFA